MSSLAFNRISFSYGREFEINNFSLKFEGGINAVAGPNGAGKTTLLKIGAGILEPCGGQVILNGRPMEDYERGKRAKLLSYIPQSDSMIFDFTVFDIAAMGRRPYTGPAGLLSKTDREAVESALNDFGVYEKKDRYYNTLSGGEKRSVYLARAVAQDASVLILDEPGAYLDIRNTAELMEKLHNFRDKGKTIIFISHDINVMSEYADTVVFMKNGESVHAGAPRAAVTEENLREIYGNFRMEVRSNPGTGRPNVFLNPKL